jgi:hypothetical protein
MIKGSRRADIGGNLLTLLRSIAAMATFLLETHLNGSPPAGEVQDPCTMSKRMAGIGRLVPGSSDLHARLRERGIDTLIISGTLSQVCCEAAARDAMMMNYKVFFITACATLTDAEHAATQSAMAHIATCWILSPF